MIKLINNPNSNIPFWELNKILPAFYKDTSNYNKILIRNKVVTAPTALYDYLFAHGRIIREGVAIMVIISINSLKNCDSKKVKFICACALIDGFNHLSMTVRSKESPWINLINDKGDTKQTVSISYKTKWHI